MVSKIQYRLRITRFWADNQIKEFDVAGDKAYVEKMIKKYKQ